MLIAKTEAGLRVMKDRSVPLTPRQRSVLILIDGKRTFDEVVAASVAIGSSRDDVEHLLALELITPIGDAPSAPASVGVTETADGRSPQQRYEDAYPIATRLTAELGLRGFRLNLAVEAAGNCEQLLQLAPKILDAVGKDKFAPLARALDLR